MKIRAKIGLAMLVAFIVGMGLAATIAYIILRRNAIGESVQDGRIIVEAASAIRHYTDNNIDPLLKEQLKIQFLPESIPFFAAKVSLQTMTKNLGDYSYREPTLNPTNVNDLADDWEKGLIDAFRNDLKRRSRFDRHPQISLKRKTQCVKPGAKVRGAGRNPE